MVDHFIKGNSVIHRIDPRIKIIYGFLFSLVIAFQRDFLPALIGLLVGIILIIVAKIRIKEIIRRLLIVDEFILLLWIILPITYPGDVLMNIWRFKISYEGVLFTLLLTIKANAIILILISHISTSNIFDIVHSLSHLKIPEKLIFLFFLLYRYTLILSDDLERIIRAAKTRGFRMRNSIHSYRTIAYIIGCLLVKSFEKGENLYRGMVSRGFHGKFFLIDHFKFSIIDLWAVIIFSITNIIIISSRYWRII